MSRIANSGNQRDLDAVNGLPPRISEDMQYAQIVHDQVLYCGTEIINSLQELRKLSRLKDGEERRDKAAVIAKRLSGIAVKCSMLQYMYAAAGRMDLVELLLDLMAISATDATNALTDPEGWAEACEIAGQSPIPKVDVPHDEMRDWRIKFLSAISSKA